jgi:pyruvate/2-oxoglutarate dehydrogenase complex dihydrolipoamide acyltransferase (E2) component
MFYQLMVPGPIEDVEEVRVLEWHVEPGEAFKTDELLVELETHKAVVEVRAVQGGFLKGLLCPAGGWRKVGEPLALMSDSAEEEPAPEDAAQLPAMPVEFEIT